MSNKTDDDRLQDYANDYRREVSKLNKENEARTNAWAAWERDTGPKPSREDFERSYAQPMTEAEISGRATEKAQSNAKQQRDLDAPPLQAQNTQSENRDAPQPDRGTAEPKQTNREAMKEHMRQQRERDTGRTRSRPR